MILIICRVDAIAVKRFGRSAGYGFVTFSSEDSIEGALALKDTEIEGRLLNVEQATPRDENAPRRSRGRGRGRGGRGGARGARTRREAPTGEPSKTVVFVGNLPYNVVDQDLVNIFDDYKVETARVIRIFNGASRGFGFVTFASEDEHKKAVERMSEVWCDDRKLIVRAAISEEGRSKDSETAHVIRTAADN